MVEPLLTQAIVAVINLCPLQVNTAASRIGKGSSTTNPYGGEISEFIIYNRALKDEERQEVESYLSKKYNIKIS